MTGHNLDLATKVCIRCGEDKPLTEYHRSRRNRDGLRNDCKACATAIVKARQAVVREQMGDEAWREHRAAIVRKSRTNAEVQQRQRLTTDAYRAAEARLRELHRAEFDAIHAQERYERGLP